jgi:hypothetical protein
MDQKGVEEAVKSDALMERTFRSIGYARFLSRSKLGARAAGDASEAASASAASVCARMQARRKRGLSTGLPVD